MDTWQFMVAVEKFTQLGGPEGPLILYPLSGLRKTTALRNGIGMTSRVALVPPNRLSLCI